MRRHIPFLLYLIGLSALSGWLMSHMSWIGRVGIDLIHKEYKFLKVWYGGATVVLGTLMLLFLAQRLGRLRLRRATGRATQLVSILIGLGGLALTYSDFRTDFSHNILKERFHLGAYLFWIGWISIGLYLLAVPEQGRPVSEREIERS